MKDDIVISGDEEIGEEYICEGPMSLKKWTDKLEGLKKTLEVAKFNEQKSKDDKEELSVLISAVEEKIKTF